MQYELSITNGKLSEINNILKKRLKEYFDSYGYVMKDFLTNNSLYDYTKNMCQEEKKCYIYAFSFIDSLTEFKNMVDGYKPFSLHIFGIGNPNEVHIVQDKDIIRFTEETNSYSTLAKGIFKGDKEAISKGKPFNPEDAYFYANSVFEARKTIMTLAGFALTIDSPSGQISNVHYD